jgi:hypothetical protein
MRFTYYTEKTVSQCMVALNDRIHSSNKLDGWTEKNGRFAISTSSKVLKRFVRRTQLEGRVEKESGLITIKGYVSDGVGPRERIIIYGALAVGGLLLMVSGQFLPGLVAFAVAPALHIPLAGDYENSYTLLQEVQRTLKAKPTPPVVVKTVIMTKRQAAAAAAKKSKAASK